MREKVDKYFGLLHPNYDSLSLKEESYAAGDRKFIFENIDEIDRKFQDIVEGTERSGEEINEQEIMKLVFDGVRTDKYIDLLHPNRAQLSAEERYDAAEDRNFIFENIDEIDRKFQDIVAGAERNGEKVDEHETIKDIIESLKTKQLTTQQIGKATIDAPTTAKVEAEQVENSENTKNNEKEGAEVGDDN